MTGSSYTINPCTGAEVQTYDRIDDAFVRAMADLTAGDPTRGGTDVGATGCSDPRDRLRDHLERSVAAGASLALGGHKPEGAGWHYPAAAPEDVPPGQPACETEPFGPVASLIRACDDAHAVPLAKDSRCGQATPDRPFGGVTVSSRGRDHGGCDLRGFTDAITVVVMA